MTSATVRLPSVCSRNLSANFCMSSNFDVLYWMICTKPAMPAFSPRSVGGRQYEDLLPHGVKRLAQICDEVLGALDADRQPHQRRIDGERRARRRRVRHLGRVL